MRKINTVRFGTIEEDESKIIHFPDGLPAFEDEHEFLIVPYDETAPYVFLQSVNTPDLAFLMTVPFIFFPNYEFKLEDDILAEMKIEKQDDLLVYSLLTIPNGNIRGMSANLLAPVVVNKHTNQARQVVLTKTPYTTKHYLFPRERKIETVRFGTIEVEESKIVRFPKGLPAFEDEHEFIIAPFDDETPYVFLQSVNTPDLAFMMTTPYLFFPDYEFRLNDTVLHELQISNPDELLVYTLLTIPAGNVRGMTANLLAPIVINKKTNQAQQVVLEKTDYTTKHLLFPKEVAK